VSAVLKVQVPGRSDFEQKTQMLGTVIHPSGLTVVSLAEIDPLSMNSSTKAKVKMSDVKFRLANNKEIPAKLVLKDPDLDLGFLMPVKEDGKEMPKLTWVNLEELPLPEILDDVVIITRLDKSLDRQPSVNLGCISAVVQKPRTFLCFETVGQGGMGVPAFRLDGKAFGICVLRKPPPNSQVRSLSSIILPGEDVMEIAQQVLKKKAE
jgi:hypothetical protein